MGTIGQWRWVVVLLCLAALAVNGCSQGMSLVQPHLKTAPLPGVSSYVAIGASDTFGTGAVDPYRENWPTDLAQMLGNNIHLINLGVPGITVHEALNAELPVAIDAHPDLITIWLAVNDLATNVPVDSYSQDLNTLLDKLRQAVPHARMAVANVPDLTLLPAFRSLDADKLEDQISAYNSVISESAASHQALLVDLSQQQYGDVATYISSDGLHPTTAGYYVIAQIFYKTLQKVEVARGIA